MTVRILMVMLISTLTSMAHADSLTGRTLSCSYNSTLGFGPVTTDYSFFVGPHAQPKVGRFSNIGGTSVEGYHFNGTKLVIEDTNDSSLIYDLATGEISRTFKTCVSGGVPDGDSHPVCEIQTEICVFQS